MRNIAANASVDTDVLPIPLRLKDPWEMWG